MSGHLKWRRYRFSAAVNGDYTSRRAAASAMLREIDRLQKGLQAIFQHPGNLPDERYTSKTGANDAVVRGLQLVAMRQIARDTLAAMPREE